VTANGVLIYSQMQSLCIRAHIASFCIGRTDAAYRCSSVVCLSVCLVTNVSPAKTAEPIEMSFGIWTRVGPSKHVLDGDAY